MTPDDRDYFLRRAMEEEQAANKATTLAARWRHEELAFLYRSRASGGDAHRHEIIADDPMQPGDIAL